jgi:hypothetical protein
VRARHVIDSALSTLERESPWRGALETTRSALPETRVDAANCAQN